MSDLREGRTKNLAYRDRCAPPKTAKYPQDRIDGRTKRRAMNGSLLDGDKVGEFLSVVKLLVGQVDNESQQRPRTVYFEDGSPEEQEALRSLARFLRSEKPLDVNIRHMLADLLDPSLTSTVDRKLAIKNRRPGRTQDRFQRRLIAECIFNGHFGSSGKEGMQITEALECASQWFCMDFKTIEKLWYVERQQIAEMKGFPNMFKANSE